MKNDFTDGTGFDSPGGYDRARKNRQRLAQRDAKKQKETTAAKLGAELRDTLKNRERVIVMFRKDGRRLLSQGYRKLPTNGKFWPLLEAAIAGVKTKKA